MTASARSRSKDDFERMGLFAFEALGYAAEPADTDAYCATITDPDGWWGPLAKGFGLKMTKDDAIPVQLAKIGLKVDDIKYVIVGHMHLDHGGNHPTPVFIRDTCRLDQHRK